MDIKTKIDLTLKALLVIGVFWIAIQLGQMLNYLFDIASK